MFYETPVNDKTARQEIAETNLKAQKHHREHDVAINALKIQNAVQSDQIKTMMKRLEKLEKKNFTGPGKRV